LPWGSLVCGAAGDAAPGVTFVGVAAGVPNRAVGWIAALGGIGALPCWIRAARWTTACGTAGPAGLARPATAGARLPGPGPAGPAPAGAAGGWLITVLMTVVLWMLLKMMLFGGGAT
jgi:hypothetical protein